ncbi:MAG: DUF4345 domain-containing protein [Sandaracinaceae bacterium]
MKSIHRVFLALAGLLAAYVGASLLLDPVGFEAAAGLELPADRQLLSEMRAPGAALLVCAVFFWWGVARERFTRPALNIAAAVYTAYGLGRLVGFALDGAPNMTWASVAAVELLVGFIAAGLAAASAVRGRRGGELRAQTA